jgi:predicted transcriptional regulator
MVSYNPKLKKDQLSAIDKTQAIPTVKDVMTASYSFLASDTDMKSAIEKLVNSNMSGLVVLGDDKKATGFLSEKDCLRQALDMKYHNAEPGQISDYMTKFVTSFHEEDSLLVAVELFTKHYFHTVPVMDNDKKVVGVLDRRTVLREVHKLFQTTW